MVLFCRKDPHSLPQILVVLSGENPVNPRNLPVVIPKEDRCT